MSLLLFGIAAVSFQGNDGGTLDIPTLTGILERLHEPLEDVSFEYEGTADFATAETIGASPPKFERYDSFTGRFLYRSDGHVLLDIYHKYEDNNRITRRTIAASPESFREWVRTEDSPSGGGTVGPGHFTRVDRRGSPVRFFCLPLLRGHLADPHARMIHEGQETVDGHECEVVTFSLDRVPDMTASNAHVETYWIDLSRGGNVLKREKFRPRGHLVSRLSQVQLRQFQDHDGQVVWLPISGTFESFSSYDADNEQRLFHSEPTVIEKSYVLVESLNLNQGIPDRHFDVEFRNETFITDQLRRAQYRFGTPPERTTKPLSHEDAEQQLETLLSEAEAQGDELRASAWSRRGWFSVWSLPYVIAIAGVVSLTVTVFILWRRA